jgi:hypothetical protein
MVLVTAGARLSLAQCNSNFFPLNEIRVRRVLKKIPMVLIFSPRRTMRLYSITCNSEYHELSCRKVSCCKAQRSGLKEESALPKRTRKSARNTIIEVGKLMNRR